jgi:signal transduction histidine kinase
LYANKAIALGKEAAVIAPQRQGLKIMLAHYVKRRNFDKALENAEEVLALEKAHPSRYSSMIFMDFGTIYQEKGDKTEAKSWFEKALEQGQKDRYTPAIATAQAYLGELALSEGKLDEAESNLLQADAMYARMNIEAARVRSFQRLGEVYIAKQNYQKARGQYERLREVATKLDDISALATAHQGLASLNSVAGNFRAAFLHLQLFAQFQDSFNKQNYSDNVAKLETQFETAKQEAKNRELTQANSIQQLELKASKSRGLFFGLLSAILAITALAIAWFFIRLRQNKQQIETQAESLKALNKTKDQLFGIIAHDLRGPVSGFQALGKIFSHHLKKGNTDTLLRLSDRVEKQSLQLKNQLDNLLHWSLQQQGNYSPQPERILIATLGKEVLALYEENAKAKGNSLKIAIDDDLVAFVDKNGLRIILNNLVHNAIKFTEMGAIYLRAYDDDERLTIEVEDSGKGMTKAQLNTFNEQKNILSQKGTAGESGTGLGLSLVQALVTRLGGSMKIERMLGKGTRVRLFLPKDLN